VISRAMIFCTMFSAYVTAGARDELTLSCRPSAVSELIHAALTNRSSLLARLYETKQRELESFAVLSGYLPQISLNAAVMRGSRDIVLNAAESRVVYKMLPSGEIVLDPAKSRSVFETVSVFSKNKLYLRATQKLIDFAGPGQQYRIARQSKRIAEIDELLQADSVRYEVERDLIRMWKLTNKRCFIGSLGMAADSAIGREEERYAVGILDVPTIWGSRARFASIEAEIGRYKDDMSEALSNLSSSTELACPGPIDNNATHFFVDTALNFAQQHDLCFYLEQAEQNRKELQIREEQIIQAQYEEDFYKKSYLPTVNLALQVDRGGIISWFSPAEFASNTLTRRRRPLWSVAIEFDWAFDGMANAHRARAAEYGVSRAIMEKNDTRRLVRQEIENSHAELGRRQKSMDAAQEALVAAQKTFAKQEAQYTLGLTSYVDFDIARQTLERADYDLLEAKSETAVAARELLFRSGYPYVADRYVIS